MAAVVYVLCALTSLLCAGLLLRSYLRTRVRLLLWSTLCFGGLALNNVFLVLDRLIFLDVDLSLGRLLPALLGMLLLVFGLIWEEP